MQIARGDWTGFRCPTKKKPTPLQRRGDLTFPLPRNPRKCCSRPGGDYTSNSFQNRALDRWISSEVQFNAKKVHNTKGELNAAQQATYEQYQNRHKARCRVGDVAVKLTSIVDKYLPKVCRREQSLHHAVPEQGLPAAKKGTPDSATNQSRDPGGRERSTGADPSGGGAEAACEKKKNQDDPQGRGTTKQKTTEENAEPDPAPPPQKQGKLSQRVTNEREEDSPPDWGTTFRTP